jgi:hypothetical protein
MRLIGRISFPIFAFILVEGFYHTRNRNQYLIRLFIFALITEVIFDLAFYQIFFYWQHQNVLFTFLIGLGALSIYEQFKVKNPPLGFVSIILCSFVAELLQVDYGVLGILMIYLIALLRGNIHAVAASIVFLNLLVTDLSFNSLSGMLQAFAGLSVIFIYAYNGKRGYNMKYFFYLFYPLHLILLYFTVVLLF